MTLRLAFMGTPDFAVPTLAEIVGAGHEVVAVYTQPPRPAGRGMEDRPSPVHAFANEAGIAVRTPASLKTDEALREFDSLDVDAAVVVAYGQILPGSILTAPREGCFNLHASLLPRWRGAAPIHRAIMAGDTETGVMVMRMEEGLDTGPVCMAERVGIETNETTGMLHDRLSRLGAGLMGRALGALERGSLDCRPQSEDGVTYAAKIDKAEARIDWARTADEVHNHIRGLSHFPGAWFELGDGDRGVRVKVLASVREDAAGVPGEVLDERLTIACGSGAVRLTAVQRAGKAKMDAETFLRGSPIAVGSRLVT